MTAHLLGAKSSPGGAVLCLHYPAAEQNDSDNKYSEPASVFL